MKLFECQNCGLPVHFENYRCERCGRFLGFVSDRLTLSALTAQGDGSWWALQGAGGIYRYCANNAFDACNWLVPVGSGESFCPSCRTNRTIPDLSFTGNRLLFQRLQTAKARLFYGLLRLGLPVRSKADDPSGVAFDFLAEADPSFHESAPVMTGHAEGLITINIKEADDAERERQRQHMAEPYRTILGHFRHEIGHYYWKLLVQGGDRLEQPSIGWDHPIEDKLLAINKLARWTAPVRAHNALDAFRALFGDERADYAKALDGHYRNGPPGDWRTRFVSAYASMHPWEDWAESWAHYLHVVDTLETAYTYGLALRPATREGQALSMVALFDAYDQPDFDALMGAWFPMAFAVNSLNRSIGQPDFYPFVLSAPARDKLRFVHDLIRAVRTP